MNKIEPEVSFLILDYNKPSETEICLKSIRANVTFPNQIIYLDNGSNQSYPFKFFTEENLCDVFITKKRGMGGGYGQTDLFRYCNTPYAIFVQSDQFLRYRLDESHLNHFIDLVETQGFHCVDLNGDQSNRGVWTDRAHFIKTDFFNSLGPFPNGGPGEFHHLPWNERHLQDAFIKNNYKIAHLKPALFTDNGVFTVREVGGGIVKMRTDTKQVWWLKNPIEPYIFPDMTEQEWKQSVLGQWEPGKTPSKYIERNEVFNCWGN